MKRILAIDTSAGTSVAVVDAATGTVLASREFENPMKHAENIGIAIAECQAEASVTARQLEAIVVGRGPAPFTGLRVGIAAAILFAEGAGRPLFGVVSLDAIALREASDGRHEGGAEQLLVTSDARRGEVYWATYGGLDVNGVPRRLRGPSVAKLDHVLEQLADAGTAYRRCDTTVRAADIAKLFLAQQLSGDTSQDVSALYLREPDAVPTPAKKVSG